MPSQWGSVHLGLTCPIYSAACDEVVRDVAAAVAGAGSSASAGPHAPPWFFVRYSEGGPHVRVRYALAAGDDPAAALRRARAAFAERGASGRHAVSELHGVAYEPETLRYGGPPALRVAETHFQQSTQLATSLLSAFAGKPRGHRLGCGLSALVVAAWALFPNPPHATAFLERYSTGYLRITAGPLPIDDLQRQLVQSAGSQAGALGRLVDSFWDALDDPARLPDPFAMYRDATVDAVRALRALAEQGALDDGSGGRGRWPLDVARVVASLAHMTSNRLGLSIPEEAYVAHLAQAALRARTSPANREAVA